MNAKKIRKLLKSGERRINQIEYEDLLQKGIITLDGSELKFTNKGNKQFLKIKSIEARREKGI